MTEWVLVPSTPTKAMIDAMKRTMPVRDPNRRELPAISKHLRRYQAAISSAPKCKGAVARLIEGAREWRNSLDGDGWSEADIRQSSRPGIEKIFDAIYELDCMEKSATAADCPK